MKIRINNYAFNKTEKSITFPDFAVFDLSGLLLIVNALTNQIIYNFADPSMGGTVLGNVLTLNFDTSPMTNSDPLLVYYDDVDHNAASDEMIGLLKFMRKAMESLMQVDPRQRQIVTIGAVKSAEGSIPTEVSGAIPVSSSLIGTGISTGTFQGINASPFAMGSTQYVQCITEGPVDQRWRVMEDSRISYQLGIRNKLTFS